MHAVTNTTAAATRMRVELLNSGTVGLGVGATVELADAVGLVVGLDDADAVLTYEFPVSTDVKPLFATVK